jgi:hypothetical protein
MELGQVFLEHLRVVARGIASDHEGEKDFAALCGYFVVHKRHFVELVGADIRAVCEAEVDL